MKDNLIRETKPTLKLAVDCYHCGEPCDNSILSGNKTFCCDGCKFVYELLQENGLCNYYELSDKPGIKVKGKFNSEKFAYLDNEEVKHVLLRFHDNSQSHVSFDLPQMHCTSCIWLLENLHTIDPGIVFSRTNFQCKNIFIVFDPGKISLRKVVELLAFIGYEPYISLNEGEKKTGRQVNRKKIFKIGIAGFCFSNIMMLSFPEYFSSGNIEQPYLAKLFSYLNLVLSLPVFFYSANEFFISAWKGLRQKWLNIDAPIALAISVTFSRSVYEILSGSGAGYLDSMSGIVFFMLVGRWFQDKTYESLSFDRDYKSYFPLGVTILKDGKEEASTISALKKGDTIIVRQNDMVPADAIIKKGQGTIDYSFVSGENTPVLKLKNELVFAGGRQLGTLLEMEVIRPVEQSYITQLWNNDIFTQQKNKTHSFVHPWSRYFTLALLSIAAGTALYWAFNDPSKIAVSVTAALIVACPCSLLLSATFTYGNMLRHFGKNKFYLKNASVIESLSKVNNIVFDKTGTLTHSTRASIVYEGVTLSTDEISMIYSLTKESIHPLSRMVQQDLLKKYTVKPMPVSAFREITGKGITGRIHENEIQVGSKNLVEHNNDSSYNANSSEVYVSINRIKKGVFRIHNQYRQGVPEMVSSVSENKFMIHVLSGDNAAEKENLESLLGIRGQILFHQTPQDKLNYIKELKEKKPNAKVLMLGDGLNDAGAMKQSDVGIAVNENSSQFTPACDGILDSNEVYKLNRFICYARSGKNVIVWSFIISILYNIVGLSFAVQGLLSPLLAAILMPASTISIVAFVTVATTISAKQKKL